MSYPLTCGAPLANEPELLAELEAYFGSRASAVDADAASLRPGLARLGRLGLVEIGVYGEPASGSLLRMCAIDAAIASFDMSSAFSLWCHRMGIEYLHQADPGCCLPQELLPRLRSAEVLGSTAFASATANYLADAPLPVTFERRGKRLLANGRIPWASNIEEPFISVAAAVNSQDPSDRVVFAFDARTPGFGTAPYPQLLALQATNSTSPHFADAEIAPEAILTGRFADFFERVFPTFILIQCAFCWGLAYRSLAAAKPLLAGQRAVLSGEFSALADRFGNALELLRKFATVADRRCLDHRQLLKLRLAWGQLAPQAVALEAKLIGGRGYTRASATARRLREAAFLPVQAPTEIQLRWLLTRSQ